MKDNRLINFLFLSNFILLNFASLLSNEKITLYDSIINIQKDASIIVDEKITVVSEGKIIKRGIFRDFPTIYYDDLKNKYKIDFEIIEIKKNGSSEEYHIENLINGQRIYIGNQNYLLKPGIYTYQIKYKANRQIGFFKNWDELYWNVTGNGWIFPIDKVIATVNLPKEIPKEKIDFDFYTGYYGSKEKNASAKIIDNKIIFQTTKTLKANQGLTVDIIWKKGFIKEPSFWKKTYFFLRDNNILIWLIFSILLILTYYIFIYLKIRNPINETIIPLFEPPNNLSPGQLRFINKMNYDDKVFTSEILDMAVNGYLKIEYKNDLYTLIKNKEPEKDSHHYQTWIRLFPNNEPLHLNKNKLNVDKINWAIEKLKSELYSKFQKKYFAPFNEYLSIGIALSSFSIIPMIFFNNINYSIIAILSFCVINIIFSKLLKQYTDQGNKILAQIHGFKMFLSATEKERINFFAAPDRTPENFEIYLPYAVAFDVEKKWTAQFKTIFEQLKEQNIQYSPYWYSARNFDAINIAHISSGINSSIHNLISSSTTPPGSISGYGSKGSSGGGGGGGGGGGW